MLWFIHATPPKYLYLLFALFLEDIKLKNCTILDKVIELAAREVSLSLSRLILLLFMAELVALDFFPFFFVAVSIHRILIRLISGDGMRNPK